MHAGDRWFTANRVLGGKIGITSLKNTAKLLEGKLALLFGRTPKFSAHPSNADLA